MSLLFMLFCLSNFQESWPWKRSTDGENSERDGHIVQCPVRFSRYAIENVRHRTNRVLRLVKIQARILRGHRAFTRGNMCFRLWPRDSLDQEEGTFACFFQIEHRISATVWFVPLVQEVHRCEEDVFTRGVWDLVKSPWWALVVASEQEINHLNPLILRAIWTCFSLVDSIKGQPRTGRRTSDPNHLKKNAVPTTAMCGRLCHGPFGPF